MWCFYLQHHHHKNSKEIEIGQPLHSLWFLALVNSLEYGALKAWNKNSQWGWKRGKYSAIQKLLNKAYIGRYNYLQLKECGAFEIKYYCKVFNYEKGKSDTCCT